MALDAHQKEHKYGTVRELEFGGLHCRVYFRTGRGSTTEIYGNVDGVETQILRMDDFPEAPHYHAPVGGPQIDFDSSLGEPHAWFVEQIRAHLPELLTTSGYASLLSSLDLDVISKNAYQITEAMVASVPSDFVLVPGVGLQRASSPE